jgi:hypothetical protein
MTSALVAFFRSSEYSSFFNPIVRRRINSSLPVGNLSSLLSNMISTYADITAEPEPSYDVSATDTKGSQSFTDMKKRLPLFSSHLGVGIAEDELYSLEEVTLSRAIAADNDIVLRRERFGNSLILVAVGTKTSVGGKGACIQIPLTS